VNTSTSFIESCGGGSGGARCLSLADYVAGMGLTGRPRRPSVLVLPTLRHQRGDAQGGSQ
jgi:hypothetical protein